jgi:hypothetical protein
MKFIITLVLFLLFTINIQAQDEVKDNPYIVDVLQKPNSETYFIKIEESNENYLYVQRGPCQEVFGYTIAVDSLLSKSQKLEEVELFLGNIALHRFLDLESFDENDVFLFNINFKYYILGLGMLPTERIPKHNKLYFILEYCKIKRFSEFKELLEKYEKGTSD